MRRIFSLVLMIALLSLEAAPSRAQVPPPAPGYYTAPDGTVYSADRAYYYDAEAHYWHKVREHKRRRNVLLGIGVLGAVTHSGAATAIGFGGAAANEVIDSRHRDY